MIYVWLFIIILRVNVVLSYIQGQHKICDYSENSFTPYSGFKLSRNYEVRCSAQPVLHYISLSHCDQGNLEYERITRTGRETDMDWSQPICLVVPPEIRKRLDNKERRNNRDSFRLIDPLLSLKIPKLPHSVKTFIKKSPPSVNRNSTLKKRSKLHACGQRWRRFLTFLSGSLGYAEYYSPDVLNTNIDELNPVSYKEFTDEDAMNIMCYKFARRKRYAVSELNIFAPYTWVGGIFQCDISDENKMAFLKHLQGTDSILSFDIECDESNTSPVGPLIAERLDRQWRMREGFSKTTLRVPYLYTPGLLDFRFGVSGETLGLMKPSTIYKDHIRESSIDDLDYDNWWKEILVTENYNYTENDIELISKVTTDTVNMIEDFIDKSPSKMLNDWDLGKPELFGMDNSSITYLQQKLFHVFSKYKNQQTILDFTKHIQVYWDELRLFK